jgi:hypothetical protein
VVFGLVALQQDGRVPRCHNVAASRQHFEVGATKALLCSLHLWQPHMPEHRYMCVAGTAINVRYVSGVRQGLIRFYAWRLAGPVTMFFVPGAELQA